MNQKRKATSEYDGVGIGKLFEDDKPLEMASGLILTFSPSLLQLERVTTRADWEADCYQNDWQRLWEQPPDKKRDCESR